MSINEKLKGLKMSEEFSFLLYKLFFIENFINCFFALKLVIAIYKLLKQSHLRSVFQCILVEFFLIIFKTTYF